MLHAEITASSTHESEWASQNRAGQERAADLVDKIRGDGGPSALGPEIKAMIEKGVFDGEAVGFCHYLACAIRQSS